MLEKRQDSDDDAYITAVSNTVSFLIDNEVRLNPHGSLAVDIATRQRAGNFVDAKSYVEGLCGSSLRWSIGNVEDEIDGVSIPGSLNNVDVRKPRSVAEVREIVRARLAEPQAGMNESQYIYAVCDSVESLLATEIEENPNGPLARDIRRHSGSGEFGGLQNFLNAQRYIASNNWFLKNIPGKSTMLSFPRPAAVLDVENMVLELVNGKADIVSWSDYMPKVCDEIQRCIALELTECPNGKLARDVKARSGLEGLHTLWVRLEDLRYAATWKLNDAQEFSFVHRLSNGNKRKELWQELDDGNIYGMARVLYDLYKKHYSKFDKDFRRSNRYYGFGEFCDHYISGRKFKSDEVEELWGKLSNSVGNNDRLALLSTYHLMHLKRKKQLHNQRTLKDNLARPLVIIGSKVTTARERVRSLLSSWATNVVKPLQTRIRSLSTSDEGLDTKSREKQVGALVELARTVTTETKLSGVAVAPKFIDRHPVVRIRWQGVKDWWGSVKDWWKRNKSKKNQSVDVSEVRADGRFTQIPLNSSRGKLIVGRALFHPNAGVDEIDDPPPSYMATRYGLTSKYMVDPSKLTVVSLQTEAERRGTNGKPIEVAGYSMVTGADDLRLDANDYISRPTLDHSAVFAEDEGGWSYESMRGVLQQMHERIQSGGTVYVHCWSGAERSVTLTYAYLILYEKLSIEDASDLVCSLRRDAKPFNKLKSEQQRFLRDIATHQDDDPVVALPVPLRTALGDMTQTAAAMASMGSGRSLGTAVALEPEVEAVGEPEDLEEPAVLGSPAPSESSSSSVTTASSLDSQQAAQIARQEAEQRARWAEAFSRMRAGHALSEVPPYLRGVADPPEEIVVAGGSSMEGY